MPWAFILTVLLFGERPQAERIADIQVQGNTLTSEEEILRLAQVEVGMPFDAQTVDAVAARLRADGRFERVDVLKRFASIADPAQIALVIIVDEGAVEIQPGRDGAEARVVKRRGPRLMFLPILGYEDGYGLTYGARVAVPRNERSRISFPLTWGAEKRAAAEFDQQSASAPVSRFRVGAGVTRRRNPFFDVDDDRKGAWADAERNVGHGLRVGVTGAWTRVSFQGVGDRFVETGGTVVFDTRIDPMLARNAVYARAAWDYLGFEHSPSAGRSDVEARGYLGLFGQSIVIGRVLGQDSSRPLPPYLKPLLGGIENLRGFAAGSAIGDTLVGASVELRMPLTSPLKVGKFGLSAFADAAAVYDKGERMRDQEFERGAGGGIWFSAALIRATLYVAHGVGASTRVHVALTASF